MRPGGAPIPNFFMPMVRKGQQGQRPGGRRVVGPSQQNQQPVPIMQQHMLSRGRVYRYPPGQNVPDGSMGGTGGGGMVSDCLFCIVLYDIGGMALRESGISQPIPIGALASALANASPTEQRTINNVFGLFGKQESITTSVT